MQLADLIERSVPPEPWAEGEKIPWHDPEFSARMLPEHLSQAHDATSRRVTRIDAQVRWIHERVLDGRPTRVLDLGCGPGLCTERLAALGHAAVGIDFSPSAIAQARDRTAATGLPCRYHLADIRTADYGLGYGLAMLIFGELNVFRPAEARAILARLRGALFDGGRLLLEVHTPEAVLRLGQTLPTWRTARLGLLSARPHLRLEESFWDESERVPTRRYYIVDAETAEIDRYAESVRAYTSAEYRALLGDAGFSLEATMAGWDDPAEADKFLLLVAVAS